MIVVSDRHGHLGLPLRRQSAPRMTGGRARAPGHRPILAFPLLPGVVGA